ncbi:MAG: hypothetical protein LQ352_007861, partial [Teloschistes flavicans]
MSLVLREKAEAAGRKEEEEAKKKAEEDTAGPAAGISQLKERIFHPHTDQLIGDQPAATPPADVDIEAWMTSRTKAERRADIEERYARFWELVEVTREFPATIADFKKQHDGRHERLKAELATTMAEMDAFRPQIAAHRRGIRTQRRLIAALSGPLRALYAEHADQRPMSAAQRAAAAKRTATKSVQTAIAKATTLPTSPKPGHEPFWAEIEYRTSEYLQAGAQLRWQLRYERNLSGRFERELAGVNERGNGLGELVKQWDGHREELARQLQQVSEMELAEGVAGSATVAKEVTERVARLYEANVEKGYEWALEQVVGKT